MLEARAPGDLPARRGPAAGLDRAVSAGDGQGLAALAVDARQFPTRGLGEAQLVRIAPDDLAAAREHPRAPLDVDEVDPSSRDVPTRGEDLRSLAVALQIERMIRDGVAEEAVAPDLSWSTHSA